MAIYVAIVYDVRDYLELSNNQYVACDLANKMSQLTGWTSMSRDTFAKKVGVEVRTLQLILKEMQEKDLIERHPTEFAFKSTKKWIETAVAAERNTLFSGGEKISPPPTEGEKISPKGVKKFHHEGEKISPHIENKKEIKLLNTHTENFSQNLSDDFSKKIEDKEVPPPAPPAAPFEKAVDIVKALKTHYVGNEADREELKSRVNAKTKEQFNENVTDYLCIFASYFLKREIDENGKCVSNVTTLHNEFLHSLRWVRKAAKANKKVQSETDNKAEKGKEAPKAEPPPPSVNDPIEVKQERNRKAILAGVVGEIKYPDIEELNLCYNYKFKTFEAIDMSKVRLTEKGKLQNIKMPKPYEE
jgi:hypothetical protein